MSPRLSDDLRTILDFELGHGNEVEAAVERDGRVVVTVKRPFRQDHPPLPAAVEPWSFDDPHYADEALDGYRSRESDDLLVFRRRANGR